MTFVLWMTGLPCSGKTTLVKRLQKDIPNLAMLDGDQLREWLSPKDFSKEARNEHNKKVAHLAKLLQNHGVSSAVSLISPYAENRKNAREIIGGETFSEVHVDCSLEQGAGTRSICRKRSHGSCSSGSLSSVC